jgi:hypothetical protein
MTSPIPTRSRAALRLMPPRPLFCDGKGVKASQWFDLATRKSYMSVGHISTGARRPLGVVEFDVVGVDFWQEDSDVNGPHFSCEVVAPSHWPSNLLLCVAARSIRMNGVISLHSTRLESQLPNFQFTMNDVHFLFSMRMDELNALLNATADQNIAFGGTNL